jgi:predicted transcriptional regulator
VVERDKAVSELLRESGPMTRNAISEVLGFSKQLTYLSLDRLRKAGLVKRCLSEESSYPLWSVAVSEPCP